MTRPFRALLVSLLLALAVSTAHAQTKITLGYTGVTDYLGGMVATDQGFFEKRGLDVMPTMMALNSLEPAALVAGSLQIALPTVSIMLQANDGGLDLVALAGTSVSDPANPSSLILARTGSGIESPRDLVGKRFGVPGLNALVHVLVREWLKEKGVDYTKVIFVEAPFPQMSDMLHNGTIDATSAADPFTSRILAAKTGYPIGHLFRDLPPGIRTSVYATTREWADTHRDAVKAFQAGLVEAKAFMEKNPDAFRPAAAKYFKLPPAAVAQLDPPKLDLDVTPQQIDYWSDVMMSQHMLNSRPNAASLIFK
jgi:NitT/TauT family transport system substrate-binding protein